MNEDPYTLKYMQTDGLRMAYADEGEGEAAVLLHGFCGSRQYWNVLVPELSESCRVIVPDLRGHGATSYVEDGLPVTMERLAEDLVLLLDAISVSRVSLFGHSLGGYAALAFAEAKPQRLKRFSLVHSTARPDTGPGQEKRTADMADIEKKGLPSFIDQLIPKLVAPEHVHSMPDVVRQAKQIGYGTNPSAAVQILAGMRERCDRNHVLQNLQIPVMLLAGAKDQLIPADRAFTAETSYIRQVTLAGSGHLGMMEKPQEMLAQIRGFMNT